MGYFCLYRTFKLFIIWDISVYTEPLIHSLDGKFLSLQNFYVIHYVGYFCLYKTFKTFIICDISVFTEPFSSIKVVWPKHVLFRAALKSFFMTFNYTHQHDHKISIFAKSVWGKILSEWVNPHWMESLFLSVVMNLTYDYPEHTFVS